MRTAGSALSGERRVVTALFCDVVGSTSIAVELDPEDRGDLVGSAMATMSSAVSRCGGTVTEFGGDGIGGQPQHRGIDRLKRGVALAAGGQTESAWFDFEEAIEVFAEYGGVPNLARAHHVYGQALEAVGMREVALTHLRTAEEIQRPGHSPGPSHQPGEVIW